MTAHAITLRPARRGDAIAIAAMSRDFIESGLGWKYDPDRVSRSIRDRDTLTLVAHDEQRRAPHGVAGFAMMQFGDEHAHLALLAVQPALRRAGIGRRLLEWLLVSSRTAGMRSVHLELRANNEAARAFYHAMGFSPTILVPRYYRGRESALRMIRVLHLPVQRPYVWHPPRRSA